MFSSKINLKIPLDKRFVIRSIQHKELLTDFDMPAIYLEILDCKKNKKLFVTIGEQYSFKRDLVWCFPELRISGECENMFPKYGKWRSPKQMTLDYIVNFCKRYFAQHK